MDIKWTPIRCRLTSYKPAVGVLYMLDDEILYRYANSPVWGLWESEMREWEDRRHEAQRSRVRTPD
jgi:hypothetical protein